MLQINDFSMMSNTHNTNSSSYSSVHSTELRESFSFLLRCCSTVVFTCEIDCALITCKPLAVVKLRLKSRVTVMQQLGETVLSALETTDKHWNQSRVLCFVHSLRLKPDLRTTRGTVEQSMSLHQGWTNTGVFQGLISIQTFAPTT